MYIESCTAKPVHYQMKEKDDTEGGSVVPHGVTLTYSCADNYYKVKGNGVITCDDGTLSAITLDCKRKLYKRHVDLKFLKISYCQFIVLIILCKVYWQI